MNHASIIQFAPPPNCLQDKIILVTGAGDGIGKVAALTYAKLGATVLLLGKTESKLEAVYDEIEASGGALPAILPMDLKTATFATMQETALLIQREFGRLDGVLHNAAILGALTPLEMYDPITFDEVMHVNMTATFRLTQALLPLLQSAKAGSVIFTTSSVGHNLRPFWGAYALSKQAVEGMCTIFSAETQNHTTLRFNCLNPGATRTNMRAHAFPGEDPMTLKTPEEIMSAYVFLMTDQSVDIKGHVIDCQPK